MNIFVLHKNPRKCAKMHCDKHVVKMILETAQILSSAIYINSKIPFAELYKPTHLKHPCVLWAAESERNFNWLAKLGLELCKEYNHRYGKIHKSKSIIDKSRELIHFIGYPYTFFKPPFVQAMPEKYKNKNVVKAYRDYYNGEKLHFCKWTNREIPKWTRK